MSSNKEPESALRTHAEVREDVVNEAYPEHAQIRQRSTVFQNFFGYNSWSKLKCEQRVMEAMNYAPVRLMVEALKSQGCDFDLSRHVTCEYCDARVCGGYDPEHQQIVVCQNVTSSVGKAKSVLAHELIHMFDYCRAKLDFRNLRHLACTEIRASALTHCSFASAWFGGDTSFRDYNGAHANCVRNKAIASVLAVRNISKSEAEDAVDSVFTKCYNDLEPFGRVLRRNSRDSEKAYFERHYYGYTVFDDEENAPNRVKW